MEIKASQSKLALPTCTGMIFKKVINISFFQSDNIYCRLNDTENNQSFINLSLKTLEKTLCELPFIRVHNCYIVNLYNVIEYNKQEAQLLMNCGTCIPVSRTRKTALEKYCC